MHVDYAISVACAGVVEDGRASPWLLNDVAETFAALPHEKPMEDIFKEVKAAVKRGVNKRVAMPRLHHMIIDKAKEKFQNVAQATNHILRLSCSPCCGCRTEMDWNHTTHRTHAIDA